MELGQMGDALCSIGDIKVLRNHLSMIGFRSHRQSHGHALCVNFPETMEVAGNILERTCGAGLFLDGGKQGGDVKDRPLSRNLVFDNSVTQALLSANDWGSIEMWQGGPFYTYNNISGNPNGNWNHWDKTKENTARLGMAYYLDGGYKNYLFNDVAWGLTDDVHSKNLAHAAFYEATPTVYNAFFNNTIYNFGMGSNWSPGGGRHLFLGSLWMNIGSWVYSHGPLKEDKKGTVPADYPTFSTAYAWNTYYKLGNDVAAFEAKARQFHDIPSFVEALKDHKPLSSENNVVTDKAPVRDAAAHDFRLAPGSAAIDHGVKLFVPWALSGVVGEWNFRLNNSDPSVLLDEHWYMTPYMVFRDEYYKAPVYNLKAENVTAASFIPGELEDWTPSALTFNGKDQFASLSQMEMTKSYTFEGMVNKAKKRVTISGKQLATPDIDTSNVLVEVYFKTEPKHTGSVLLSKLTDAGYRLAINKAGGVTFTVKSGDAKFEVASGARINDGKWHHVIAELDRVKSVGTIYVDGRQNAEDKMELAKDASLSNSGDLLVGKDDDGHFFNGAIDFLRIARGTLADAKTSIDELYDWEFDGPFLRDFMGHEKTGERRDAGAFEFIENQTSMSPEK